MDTRHSLLNMVSKYENIYYICCGSILSLVQILFSFVFGMVMSLKQRKIKFEPRTKLANTNL